MLEELASMAALTARFVCALRAASICVLSVPRMSASAAYVDNCTHVDITKQTLRVYRVDAELIDMVMHGCNKQTIEIHVKDVAALQVYTGILAPSKTCYIDVCFKDSHAHPKRCFLICGHPAAKLTIFEAGLAGIPVDSEFGTDESRLCARV
jgi:hypothetical protein